MIDAQLHDLNERIESACRRVGRDSKEVQLVLVSKEVDLEEIKKAYQAGVRDFAENRVQDLIAKKKNLPLDIRWHFIGTLQTNKAKQLVGEVVLLHSCDRIELARELQKQAEKRQRTVEILIQVNASREKTKHGFSPEALKIYVSEMAEFDRLKIRGLMTIGPNTENQEQIRKTFRSLRVLRDQMQKEFPLMDWGYLSMGMSSDFELAIEEGANILRIGTAVFGERKA